MSRTKIEREYEHPRYREAYCKTLKENGKYIQVRYWRKKDILDMCIIKNYDVVEPNSKTVPIDHPVRYCRECSEIEKPDVSECPVCGNTMMIYLPEEDTELPNHLKLVPEEIRNGE